MKTNVIKIYYILLGGLVATQVFYTLVCGGSLLYTRGQIHTLKQEFEQLKDQQIKIQTNRSHQVSLNKLLESKQLAEYTSIKQPISIQAENTLAFETN